MCINIQALYDALARIIEQRENVNIKVTVERKIGNEKDS